MKMKPKVAKRITPPTTPPNSIPPPLRKQVKQTKLVRKRPLLVQGYVVFEQTTIFNGLLNTGTKLYTVLQKTLACYVCGKSTLVSDIAVACPYRVIDEQNISGSQPSCVSRRKVYG